MKIKEQDKKTKEKKMDKEEFNLSKKIIFADSRDLIDLNSEGSANKRMTIEDISRALSGDDWTAELITIIGKTKYKMTKMKNKDFQEAINIFIRKGENKMKNKICPYCKKIIKGISKGALETYYNSHIKTHKLKQQLEVKV